MDTDAAVRGKEEGGGGGDEAAKRVLRRRLSCLPPLSSDYEWLKDSRPRRLSRTCKRPRAPRPRRSSQRTPRKEVRIPSSPAALDGSRPANPSRCSSCLPSEEGSLGQPCYYPPGQPPLPQLAAPALIDQLLLLLLPPASPRLPDPTHTEEHLEPLGHSRASHRHPGRHARKAE